MERFSASLQEEARPLWEAFFSHPFLRALQEGSLPREAFRFFLVQDYHYLGGFARAVGLALAHAPDTASLRLLSERVLRPAERSLHRDLLARMGVEMAEVERTPLAPTTVAYINHLLATASLGALGEACCALLPCPWLYQEMGERLGPIEDPLYEEWARFYREGGLGASVEAWRGLADAEALRAGPAGRERMRRAFLLSCRYEVLFLEMAWRREGWPV